MPHDGTSGFGYGFDHSVVVRLGCEHLGIEWSLEIVLSNRQQSFSVEVIEVLSPVSTNGSFDFDGVSSGSKCSSG